MGTSGERIRAATAEDSPELMRLWALLFDEDDTAELWRNAAGQWFDRFVGEHRTAHFPVIDVGGNIVAAAIGTLELGVPNPQCPQGHTFRLANVITLTEHRGHGYGSLLVQDVIKWARSVDADRLTSAQRPTGSASTRRRDSS